MNRLFIAALFAAVATSSIAADVPTATRVRGTITAVDGNIMSVKSRDGKDLKIELTKETTFAYPKALKLADIKPGTPLGTAAVRGPDGKLVARELHVFPADRPVPNEGHRPWDLEPDSSMTNAMVSSMVQANNGRELTLTYKGGSQQVLVPESAPIVMAVDADRSVLKPGEYAFIAANVGVDGKMTATRVQVSKDGVKPPQ